MDSDIQIDNEKNEINISVRNIWSDKRKRILESVFPIPNLDEGTKDDDRFYANLEKAAPLDLDPTQLHQTQRYSLRAYFTNPDGRRTIENTKNFTIGDGVRFRAADPKVQELLEKHWIVNEWEDKLEGRALALSLFGEQFYPAFVNDENGFVRISSISPFRIITLNRHGDDAENIVSVTASLGDFIPTALPEKMEKKIYNIIKPDDDGKLTAKGPDRAFYFAINRISGATRGVPDLVASLDYLEAKDSFTFSIAERANLASNVVFDLTVKGATNDQDIRKRVDQVVNAIKSGTVFGHNDSVDLTLKVPNLAAIDAKAVSDLLDRAIQSGTGYAGLFFGNSDDLTRASASEISIPVAKALQVRQGFQKRIISKVFTFQIEEARKAGSLVGVTNFRFEIDMARIFLRDFSAISKSLVELSTSLGEAQDREWLTQPEAASVFRLAIEQLTPLPPLSESDEQEAIEPELKQVEKVLNIMRAKSDKANGSRKTEGAAR